MILTRRSFLVGALAAPIVVRSGVLMKVRPVETEKTISEMFFEWRELTSPPVILARPTHLIVQQQYIDAARQIMERMAKEVPNGLA